MKNDNKMWGGRFRKEVDASFFEFQKSLAYDWRLGKCDIFHSLLHIAALKEEGILSLKEHLSLKNILLCLLKEIEKKEISQDKTSEDIHTYIQNQVKLKSEGDIFAKLHSYRSRNEQIAFDEACFCILSAEGIDRQLLYLIKSISYLARRYSYQDMVGYTHTQRAQKVKFLQYFLVFSRMFSRDRQRLRDFLKNINLYLGAGALAGSPISKISYQKAIKKTSKFLPSSISKKIKVVDNPLDVVSDRDFLGEFLFILSLIQLHLCRLSEEIILFSTKEFGFFSLPEEFCTGSSLLAQKKNPDFLELVRGYTGKIYGNLMGFLTTMKALPLTYNRDLQVNKEFLFSCLDILRQELEIMSNFVRKIKLNKENIKNALCDETIYLTDILTILVKKGVPFKEAHNVLGKLLLLAEEKKVNISQLPEKDLKKIHPLITKELISHLKDNSLN